MQDIILKIVQLQKGMVFNIEHLWGSHIPVYAKGRSSQLFYLMAIEIICQSVLLVENTVNGSWAGLGKTGKPSFDVV